MEYTVGQSSISSIRNLGHLVQKEDFKWWFVKSVTILESLDDTHEGIVLQIRGKDHTCGFLFFFFFLQVFLGVFTEIVGTVVYCEQKLLYMPDGGKLTSLVCVLTISWAHFKITQTWLVLGTLIISGRSWPLERNRNVGEKEESYLNQS